MSKALHRSVLAAVVLLSLAAVGPSGPAAAAGGYRVIVNAANPTSSLAREQVANVFLKKRTSWPSGAAILPVDLNKSAPARAAFSREVLHKLVADVTAYWQQQIFAGRAVPPPEMDSDAEVVAFVEGSEGAIGYVSEGAAIGDAKAVRIVD